MIRPTDQDVSPVNGDAEVPAEIRAAYTNLDAEGPPELLDVAVLSRARAAVEQPHSSRPWSFGWPHALGTVAVIALGLTVLLQLREPSQPGLPVPGPAPAASQPATAPAPMRAREAEASANVAREAFAADKSTSEHAQLQDAGSQAMDRQTLQDNPEAWLAEIRRLQQAGLEEQAAGELAQFCARWPEFPIPGDLDP